MTLQPVYTKHFAERFLERCDDFDVLKRIKRKIRAKFCEHVFDCLIREPLYSHKISVDGFTVIMTFNPTSKKLTVRTIY